MILLRNVPTWAPAPLGPRDVVLAGGKIEAVGHDLRVPAGLPVTVVEGAELRLVPGLVDAHVHIGGGGGEGGAHTRVPPQTAASFLSAGVTTVVGLLGTDTVTRTMADLLAVARGLEHHGLTALCYTGGYTVPPTTLTGSARADLVHVDRIVAIGETAISDHRSSQPSFAALAALAADAHVAGLMTGKAGLLHLHLGDGPRGLAMVRRALDELELPPRVWHPTHVNRRRALWREAMELAARGLVCDVTAFPAPWEPGEVPPAEALAEWHTKGLPWEQLTMSSDGGGCLPSFDADGVLLHMDVGRSHTLLQAVFAAEELGVPFERGLATVTSNVARQFRLPTKGRIAAGLDADVVLLRRDGAVARVWAGGREVWAA